MAKLKRPLPQRGEVYGCWTVLRETRMVHKCRAFVCRASCCGAEVIKQHSDILRATPTCVHCKGNGKGGSSLRHKVVA